MKPAAQHPDLSEASPQTPLDLSGEAYPPMLRDAERRLITARREKSGLSDGEPLVGMALSGGGIRSATFCLGLFQALARRGVIGKIDLLSTVSGGGYFGSFLGGLFVREGVEGPRKVAETLRDPRAWPIRWLRENGRYMSPNGAGDAWLAAAALLRNWVAIHVVLITLLLSIISLAGLGRYLLPSWSFDPATQSIWWSPYVLLPAIMAVPCVLFGAVYWLTQLRPLMRGVQRLLSAFGGKTGRMKSSDFVTQARNRLSRWLSVCLMLTLVLLAFGVLDSAGQTLYARLFRAEGGVSWAWMTGGAATSMGAFGVAQKLFLVFDKLPGKRGFRLPLNAVALLVALVWAVILVLGVVVLTYGFAWGFESPLPGVGFTITRATVSWGTLAIVALAAALLSWWFSVSFGFVNLSSHQQLYASRLKRAYLGASNPARYPAPGPERNRKNLSLTEPIEGDEIAFEAYHPEQNGGPLHLINVTVNETISGKSQVQQRDRKGLPLSVGPCGLSVGIDDHALWEEGRSKVQPVVVGRATRFHTLAAGTLSECERPHAVEPLGLGNWIAISGAAFTTGLGSGTRLGLSLLLGLANVRLGYWWDSGVDPSKRADRTRPSGLGILGEIFGRILPVHASLLDECFARFHGPARRHWYLTDGGHFENTACYELVRRRVPFIIASDAGRDTAYEFADIANLVRKARTDFNAEIEFVRRGTGARKDGAVDAEAIASLELEQLVHPDLLPVIGAPEDFWFMPGTAPGGDEGAARSKYGTHHALLARVHYLDTHEISYILFVKPSLSGDEPTDLLQYQKSQPDFPQESTMDQYFDEAQWESYRKLGEHIGSLLFAQCSPGDPRWSPREMRKPEARPRSPAPGKEKPAAV